MDLKKKREKRYKRHKRIRGKVFGTVKKPRLCVFRSNKHIYAQLINDEKNKVLASVGDLKIKVKKGTKETKGKKENKRSGKLIFGFEVGKMIAKKAKELKIEEVIFDRGGYKYHGRVRALAEGAREAGLKF